MSKNSAAIGGTIIDYAPQLDFAQRNQIAPAALLREALHIAGVRRCIVSFLVVHNHQQEDCSSGGGGGGGSAEAATRRAAIELSARFHGLKLVLGRKDGPRGQVRLRGLSTSHMNGMIATC